MTESRHAPVLLNETLLHLNVHPGGIYVDCTLDGGGHALAILKQSSPDGILIGLDMDAGMIEQSRPRFEAFKTRAHLINRNFAELPKALEDAGVSHVDGILADLGFSSNQLDAPERGLSFMNDGPLDMRLDKRFQNTAADLLVQLSESDLSRTIKRYSDERFASRIARATKQRLEKKPITRTLEFAELVESAIPRKFHPKRIHTATRTFQALRIAVNQELDSLETMLPAALESLKIGGRLAVITYHSLEDRIVSRTFKEWKKGCICPPRLPMCVCDNKPKVKFVTRKGLMPTETEIADNPRARSARLRVVERLDS